ncbi:hypothetical protein FQA47_012317 [Oryzias melastigma]|uniref:Uncharacterized protein n=1 Tax=Oryzias melastigma TaxID=30732 RepID=A0A834CSC7_ORYME|nr:hypothetical protein FQA47_012317 [Oryzias melastigma]
MFAKYTNRRRACRLCNGLSFSEDSPPLLDPASGWPTPLSKLIDGRRKTSTAAEAVKSNNPPTPPAQGGGVRSPGGGRRRQNTDGAERKPVEMQKSVHVNITFPASRILMDARAELQNLSHVSPSEVRMNPSD